MDHDRLEPISDEATLLAKVARRRREIIIRRRLLQGLAGALSLVLVAFGAVMAMGGGAEDRPLSGIVDREDTSSPSPSPVLPPSPFALEPEGSDAATPQAEPCRNSFDPVCGPFYWDPEPDPGEPLRMTIEFSPANPRASDEVTFSVSATDDASTDPMVTEGWFGDGGAGFGVSVVCASVPERYGPWTPPERQQRTRQDAYTHTYEHAGTYEVTFKASTDECNFKGYDPYASEATESIRITVRDASRNPLPL